MRLLAKYFLIFTFFFNLLIFADETEKLIEKYKIDVSKKSTKGKKFEEAILNLIQYYYIKKEFNNSEKYCDMYLKRNETKNDLILYWCGETYFQTKNYKKSYDSYSKIDSSSNLSLEKYLGLGKCSIKLNDKASAEKYFNIASTLANSDDIKEYINKQRGSSEKEELYNPRKEKNEDKNITDNKNKIEDMKKNYYTCQLAVFSSLENAKAFINEIKKFVNDEIYYKKDGDRYKIFIGKFDTINEAKKYSQFLRKEKNIQNFVTRN